MDVKPTLESLVNQVDYSYLNTLYKPSVAAIAFVNFIKLVNGSAGEENKSPVIHMDMIDRASTNNNNLYVAARGTAKTTALHEYMYLFLATYGEFFDFGEVNVGMYISDTIDNGVKSMRNNLQFRYENSEFLQRYVPKTRFTDVRWEFTNIEGKKLCIRGFGASTGVRGFKEYGQRPTWLGMDDLMSDKNAESPTIIADMQNVIYKAARAAMHPHKRKVIWTGTPFNQRDPLYQAAGSNAWTTAVYPLCEKFPCTKEEFRGAWEDRFPYEFVKQEYDLLLEAGQISAFNQELMLRIMSDEDRLIQDADIQWYDLESLKRNKSSYNFYITTDLATSEKESSDYSVISVWALNSVGYWYWVDGVCARQTMDVSLDDIFRLAQKYKPLSVGIEVSGQQQGFVSIIQRMMMDRTIFFNLASDNNGSLPGIRPNTNKMVRFNSVVPWFKSKKMYFPDCMKDSVFMVECMNELELASIGGFKSKHDDIIDTISMLSALTTWRPSVTSVKMTKGIGDVWEDFDMDDGKGGIEGYLA